MVSEATLDKLHKQRARRVAKAERESGYKEGRYTLGGMLGQVHVSFYLGASWWWREATKENVPLTDELWATLVPYPEPPHE